MGILNAVQELSKDYLKASEECLLDLCKQAGVTINKNKTVKAVKEELAENGFTIDSIKYAKPDNAVGQYLILRTTSDKFISGYDVSISFIDYTVRERVIITENDIMLEEIH